MSKERPVIFSGEMIRAILVGKKTMTRRVMKPQPFRDVVSIRNDFAPSGVALQPNQWCSWTASGDISKHVEFEWKCPFGQAGDALWVRETWGAIWPDMEPVPLKECRIEYKADTPNAPYPGDWPIESKGDPDCPLWRSPIHMPRWASRITLEITGVKVERVQDISELDAVAEGVWAPGQMVHADMRGRYNASNYTARNQFMYTWEAINFDRGHGWNTNPWVWALTFKIANKETT